MESAKVLDTCQMDSDDNLGLSEILDVLSTFDHLGPNGAFINIVEQPAGKALRFRYECEGRSAGSIPGVNSKPENKTYPTIEIVGHKGDARIVVSCVTKDPPYRPHPHKLVGKEGCKEGICTMSLSGGQPLRAVFNNLGIQCVKRKKITQALKAREDLNCDPFKTSFDHKEQPSSIDLNAVRLCFQAYVSTDGGKTERQLAPVVSDPIYDRKAMADLVICRLCSCAAKVGGGDSIILLCEKVARDDIKVKFFEEDAEGTVVWEDYAEFQQTDIHKQAAITFKTPRYHNTDILEKTKVFVQLVRPSDGVVSEPIPFEYYPDPDQIKRKRLKTGRNPMNILRKELQKYEQLPAAQFANDFKESSTTGGASAFWNIPFMADVKTEPAASVSPQNFGGHRSPYNMMHSPQPFSTASPSPIQRNLSTSSAQSQMCDMFNFSPSHEPRTSFEMPHTLSPSPFQESKNSFLPTTASGRQDDSKYTPLGNLNPFYNPFAPLTTSGGSITPVWPMDVNSNPHQLPLLTQMNIVDPLPQTQPPQEHQHQQQQPPMASQFQPNDFDNLANIAAEEGPSLSALLAFVDSEQLVNINSDDLPLSNLSITT